MLPRPVLLGHLFKSLTYLLIVGAYMFDQFDFRPIIRSQVAHNSPVHGHLPLKVHLVTRPEYKSQRFLGLVHQIGSENLDEPP